MRLPVDETTAWLYQARADWQAAERFVADEVGTGRCHAIAKWQQTVEKAVKALVSALHGAGILGAGVLPKHAVERYIRALISLPRAAGNRTIQQNLHGLLDQNTRAGIRALDGLAPQRPPRRNTEYYSGTEEAHTNPTRQRGECLRALAGASG